MKSNLSIILVTFIIISLIPLSLFAQEIDTDGDGYDDKHEIENGFSPFNPNPVKAAQSDMDKDGLNDLLELKFKTDPFKIDSDDDTYSDFKEIDFGYNPLSSSTKKINQKIEISLSKQKMTYYVGGEKWKELIVSTGKKNTPTPTGEFKIVNKSKKAWSKAYGLWMPFWLGLDRGRIGIHELPVWPNGYREGENHLGKPVSHGCVRLGVGAAQYIYDRIDIGTEVKIVK